VLTVIAFLCMAAFITAVIGLRGVAVRPGVELGLRTVVMGYRTIFKNPQAKICFGAVMLEGIFVMGVFPYVALLLHERGEFRAAIAGIVIAGFALGGVIYTLTISRLLVWLGERGLMLTGAGFMGFALLAFALRTWWPVEMAEFLVLGCGFYMMHGVIQIYATELAPAARGSAASLHSGSFFLGLAIGPVYFGFGLAHAGLLPTVALSAAVIFITGYVCAAKLRRQRAS
jgi:predicted MFS family arabinose efflux permease